jgi:hypothetical protein
MQQPEFGRAERKRLCVAGHPVRNRIDPQSGDLDRRLPVVRLAATQQCPDARDKFFWWRTAW